MWEYKIIIADRRNHKVEHLDEYGSKGWELAGVMPAPNDANGIVFYFKRPSHPR